MRVILSLMLAVVVVGCGANPSASRLMDVQSDSVFLAVFGGNASCKPDQNGQRSPLGMDMYRPFVALSDRLTTDNGWHLSWILTCHNSDASVHYVTSDDPEAMRTMPIPEVAPFVESFTTANSPGHVFIGGHSYGGWLALKVALALPDDLNIEGLFSIDAISRKNCTFANPAECTQAPTDITRDQRRTLSDRTAHWINFFENQTFYLHSSPISEADENLKVATSHTGIDTHANVWTKVTNVVASRFF